MFNRLDLIKDSVVTSVDCFLELEPYGIIELDGRQLQASLLGGELYGKLAGLRQVLKDRLNGIILLLNLTLCLFLVCIDLV